MSHQADEAGSTVATNATGLPTRGAGCSEPPRFQLIVQLAQFEGIDSRPEGASEAVDLERPEHIGPRLLGGQAATQDVVHDLLERPLAPMRQVAQIPRHVIVQRECRPHAGIVMSRSIDVKVPGLRLRRAALHALLLPLEGLKEGS